MMDRLAKGLLRPINPYLSVLLGLFTLSWGAWVVNPFIKTFDEVETYRKAVEFAPEWAWGTWSIIAGASIIIAIWKNNVSLLSGALAFATWHWFTVGGMTWWGDWHNTAGLTYTFVALYSTSAYLNIRTNYVRVGRKEL